MSPARPSQGAYVSPRRRHEMVVAAVGIAVIIAVAAVLIWVLAPHTEPPFDPSTVVPSTAVTPSTTTGTATTTSSTTPG